VPVTFERHDVPVAEPGPIREVVYPDASTLIETRVRFIGECGCVVDFGVRLDSGEKGSNVMPCDAHPDLGDAIKASLDSGDATRYGDTAVWLAELAGEIPRDEHGNEATGVCMNCGAAMVENPMFPWCKDCEDLEDEDESRDS
jgi:hypothetical protein